MALILTVFTLARWIVLLPGVFAIFVAPTIALHRLGFSDDLSATLGGTVGAGLAVWMGSRIVPSWKRSAGVLLASVVIVLTLLNVAQEMPVYAVVSWIAGSLAGLYLAFRGAARARRPVVIDGPGHSYKGTTSS